MPISHEEAVKLGLEEAPAQPATPEPSAMRQLLDAATRGSPAGKVGGAIGGVIGQIVAGRPGSAAGAFLGHLVGENPPRPPEYAGGFHVPPPRIRGEAPMKPMPDPAETNTHPDFGAAAADAGMQAVAGQALRGAGGIAARLGFPRVAAALGAVTPRAAAVGAAPEAAKHVSTEALQAVDAAALNGAPAGKNAAAILGEIAQRDANIAAEKSAAEANLKGISARMSSRVPGLAQKTEEFGNQLRDVVPADKLDKAFADAPSVLEAAESAPVMQARQAMISDAVPQSADALAVKMAKKPIAAAAARGVGSFGKHAADAAGLRSLGGDMPANVGYLNAIANRVPGVGAVAQAIPKGGMSPARVMQSVVSLLEDRGMSSVNPAISRTVADNGAYRASPAAPLTAAQLRILLDKVQGR